MRSLSLGKRIEKSLTTTSLTSFGSRGTEEFRRSRNLRKKVPNREPIGRIVPRYSIPELPYPDCSIAKRSALSYNRSRRMPSIVFASLLAGSQSHRALVGSSQTHRPKANRTGKNLAGSCRSCLEPFVNSAVRLAIAFPALDLRYPCITASSTLCVLLKDFRRQERHRAWGKSLTPHHRSAADPQPLVPN